MCNRYRGAIYSRDTVILYGLEVAAGNLGVPSGRRHKIASISSSCGISTSLGTIHYGSITNEDGIWPSQMSLVNASTFLSSGLGLAKDGVTNLVPQSNLVYGSWDSRQTSTSGLSPTIKVNILSSLNLRVVS